MSILSMTAVELSKKIKEKEISVKEAVQASLDQIEAGEKKYNCYVTVDPEGALAQAEAIQKKIDDGELTGPLAGRSDGCQGQHLHERSEDDLQFEDPVQFCSSIRCGGGGSSEEGRSCDSRQDEHG